MSIKEEKNKIKSVRRGTQAGMKGNSASLEALTRSKSIGEKGK